MRASRGMLLQRKRTATDENKRSPDVNTQHEVAIIKTARCLSSAVKKCTTAWTETDSDRKLVYFNTSNGRRDKKKTLFHSAGFWITGGYRGRKIK